MFSIFLKSNPQMKIFKKNAYIFKFQRIYIGNGSCFSIYLTDFLKCISVYFPSWICLPHTYTPCHNHEGVLLLNFLLECFLQYSMLFTVSFSGAYMSNKDFECPQCCKRYKNAGGLKTHMKTHKKPEPKSGSMLRWVVKRAKSEIKPRLSMAIELKP